MSADEAPFLRAPSWAFQMLQEGRVARLGTADAQGRPLVVPVCFVFDGRAIYSTVDGKPKRRARLRRLANLEQNPSACLLLDHYAEDWRELRYVIVHGTAEVTEAPAELEYAVTLLVDKYPQYQRVPPLATGMSRDRETLLATGMPNSIPSAAPDLTRERSRDRDTLLVDDSGVAIKLHPERIVAWRAQG